MHNGHQKEYQRRFFLPLSNRTIANALKDELPRSVGAQYAMGDQWRNNSRKNEEMEPKQKQHTFVEVTGDGSKSDALKRNIA